MNLRQKLRASSLDRPRALSSTLVDHPKADLPTFECQFRCTMPNCTTRVVRGFSGEGWAGFQHRVREELRVAKAAFTYVDQTTHSVKLVEDDASFRVFLSCNGTYSASQPMVYRLLLGI